MAGREINLEKCDTKEPAQCHLMPCRIEHNHVEVKAKEYFWPTIRELNGDDAYMAAGRDDNQSSSKIEANNQKILTASFRGRPLQGRKLALPKGYKGHLVSKDGKYNRKFNEFTYWNWDQIPKDDDKVVKALSWLKISEALSS